MADNDTQATEDGFEQAKDAAQNGTAALLAGLAERIGASAGAKAVFGDPIEKNGLTVIPVAQSMWGTGAGSGESEETGFGSGGGGGAMSRPLGYIEVTDDGAVYVPLRQPWQDPKYLIGAAFAFSLVAISIRRIIRG